MRLRFRSRVAVVVPLGVRVALGDAVRVTLGEAVTVRSKGLTTGQYVGVGTTGNV